MLVLEIDKNVSLKTFEDRDAVQLFATVDKNRAYLRRWLPWLDANISVQDTLQFIRSVQQQEQNNLGFQTGIWMQGKIIGAIGFHPIDWANRVVEIGYWLDSDYQGQGVMTRACKRLVDYAFDEFRLNRVQIRCATGNKKSCAIVERLGFIREGIAREAEFLYDHYVDLYVYGMTSREWQILRQQQQMQKPNMSSLDLRQ